MSVTPLPSDIYYARILATYFGGNTEADRLTYWDSFTESRGYSSSSPPQDSDALRTDFAAFLKEYKDLGITAASLRLGNNIPSSNIFYSTILNTYFSTLSDTEKTDIWNGFVASQGFTTNPPDTADIREAFSSYVKILTTSSIKSTLDQYFGSFPQNFRIALWEKYAASKGVSSLVPADTPVTQAEFRQFIQRYIALGINYESIQLNNSIPASSFYQNYMNGFFGNLSSVEQQDLWNAFLYTQNLTTNPPDSPNLQLAFSKYITTLAAKANVYEMATALSPQEMKTRLILNNVLGSLKSFLNTTQDLIKVQSSTLMFYGAWQKNYTDMMTRVPNLTGGDAPKVKTDANDLSLFTFGYNDISLQDVIRWGVNQAVNNPGTNFSFGNTSPATTPDGYTVHLGQYSFQVNVDTSGVKTLVIQAKESTSFLSQQSIVIEDLTNPSAPTQLSFDNIVEQAGEKFKQMFTAMPGFLDAINGQGGIPGRYLGITNPTGDAQIKANADALQLRSEANAALQQIVENIRSLRDNVQTFAKQLQTNLNQAREGLNQQTSLWTAILESIDSVMQAINKSR